jgi:hypothetical protein
MTVFAAGGHFAAQAQPAARHIIDEAALVA